MLPISKLTVINQALLEIGKLPVTNEDDSDAAKGISAKVDILLPVLLRRTRWKFAIKYIEDNTPNTLNFSPDFNYTYQLPADYGRFFMFSSLCFPIDYMIVDGLLLTNVKPVQYYYIVNTADYDALSVMFVRALAVYVAADMAPTLTNNVELIKVLNAKAREEIANAVLFDDMERRVRTTPYNEYDRQQYF